LFAAWGNYLEKNKLLLRVTQNVLSSSFIAEAGWRKNTETYGAEMKGGLQRKPEF